MPTVADFSVHVLHNERTAHETSDNYVVLPHDSKYKLKLENSDAKKCDARVSIDGSVIGTWRISAHSSIVIERPAEEAKLFTFYETQTPEARAAGLAQNNSTNGLISVTFMPEKQAYVCMPRSSVYYGDEPDGLEAFSMMTNSRQARRLNPYLSTDARSQFKEGGTGLQGRSSQKFFEVPPLTLADESEFVTVNLRLVGSGRSDAQVTPLRPVARSNPVPAAIF